MSEEKPKPGPGAPAPSGPPRLDRVPAGYRPPPTAARTVGRPGEPPPAAPRPAATASATAAAAATYGLAAREVGADAALAAGLAHQGTLANESGLRLFALAAALQATGRLTISPEGRAYALAFRRGTVEHAASTDPEDDLGRFLVRKGALSEDGRVKAEGAKAAAGGDLAGALVAARLVNLADVAALLQEHGAALVQRALAVESGGWSWKPDAPPPPSAFPLGSPFAMLCAAVRALDATALLRRLGDREHRAAGRVGGRLRVEDLRLTPQETRAAQLFDGVRSPAEIAVASPGDTLTVLRLALLLGEADLLSFGASRKGEPAPRASAGAPAAGAAAPPAVPAPHPPAPPPGAARPPAPATARPPRAAPPPRPAAPGQPRPAPAGPRPAVAGAAAAARPATTPVPRPAPALDRAALEARLVKLADADHFEVLGVGRDAAGPQIKLAYFQLAKTYHPDAVAADAPADLRKLCADLFAKVSEAWSVLGADASRAAYLEQLASGGAASVDVNAIFQAESTFEEAVLLVKARRYAEALEKLAAATKLNPDEAEFGMWKAWCEFLLAPDRKKALAGCAAAIEGELKRNARCAQGYLFLGQMAKLVGDLGLAEKYLKRGLQVAPEHADLQRELKYLRK